MTNSLLMWPISRWTIVVVSPAVRLVRRARIQSEGTDEVGGHQAGGQETPGPQVRREDGCKARCQEALTRKSVAKKTAAVRQEGSGPQACRKEGRCEAGCKSACSQDRCQEDGGEEGLISPCCTKGRQKAPFFMQMVSLTPVERVAVIPRRREGFSMVRGLTQRNVGRTRPCRWCRNPGRHRMVVGTTARWAWLSRFRRHLQGAHGVVNGVTLSGEGSGQGVFLVLSTISKAASKSSAG